jgi:hypothetical protein
MCHKKVLLQRQQQKYVVSCIVPSQQDLTNRIQPLRAALPRHFIATGTVENGIVGEVVQSSSMNVI